MALDWKDVATVVAPLAPTLGGLLGGLIPFPGGGLAGQAIGNLIAKQFGVDPTPDAVKNAIQSSPNELAIAKLRAAADEAKAMWPALAQVAQAEAHRDEVSISQINATMRAELENRHWFFTGWRPMAGWIFDMVAIVFAALLAYATLLALRGDKDALRTITDAWPAYAVLLGTLALMVGVYIVGRSQEKKTLIESIPTPQPSPLKPKGR